MTRAALVLASGWLALVLSACGHDAATPDAQVDALAGACVATYSGNFADAAASPDACARIDGADLVVALPTRVLDAPPELRIAVTAPGAYSPATVAMWRLDGARTPVPQETCLVVAGAAVAPHGSFALALDAIAPPHGRAGIDAAILSTAFAHCGDPLTVHVEVSF